MKVLESASKVNKRQGTILIVEDDQSLRRLTQGQLDRLGYQTRVAADVPEALELLKMVLPDLVICDLHLPGESGLELLKKIRLDHPQIKFVMVTSYGSVKTAIEAMKGGAYDYLTKPVHPVELRTLVERAFEQQHLVEEVQMLRRSVDQKFGFESLIGESAALASVIDVAARAARTAASVLITGETGTGKELLAKAIHFNGPRRERPFVVVNCGSIPRELVESELFGHVKGAFTGAVTHKKGMAELADGGTLFLDEIGEMPPEMQVRLLRLIQEGEVQKVGDPHSIRVDVHIIAATHRSLEDLIRSGSFREDLYYRLAVVPIEIPPLRKRADDIPELVHYFFEKNREKYQRMDLRLPESLMSYFVSYDWPGNVRQLANCVVRIVVLAQGPEVQLKDLPEFLQIARPVARPRELAQTLGAHPEERTLDEVEREMIVDALAKSNWNQTHAALHLGVTRKALRGRIEKYGIRKTQA